MPDTVPLHFTETGRGLPVVLLHGFPLNHTIWQKQLEQLGQTFRVIAPDLRGHGRSPVPADGYEMETMARDVFALLDRLGIERAAIFGHSMGGYIALAGWRIAPERFLALGLVASQAGADSDEARGNRYKLAEKVHAIGSAAVAVAMVPKLFAADRPESDPLVAQLRQMMSASPTEGIVGALHGMAARPSSEELLPAISVATLILAGAADKIIPHTKAEAMARAIPHATLEIVEGAGHMPMLERAEETSAALRRFLEGLKTEV